jgi:hypothetical protein
MVESDDVGGDCDVAGSETVVDFEVVGGVDVNTVGGDVGVSV